MNRQLLFLVSAIAITTTTPGIAAGPPDEKGNGRYTMAPADNGGFVRLDTKTGAMALCNAEATGWSCKEMPDSNQSLAEENARLKTENKALNNEIKEMEETFGLNGPSASGPQAENSQPPAPLPPKFKLPTEQEVDKALDYVERMIKKFKDRFRQLEESKKNHHGDAEPTPL